MKLSMSNHIFECKDISDVPESVLQEYDYLGPEELDGFFTYNKQWYNLADFMAVDPNGELASLGIHGVATQSAFHGVVIRILDDGGFNVGTVTDGTTSGHVFTPTKRLQ